MSPYRYIRRAMVVIIVIVAGWFFARPFLVPPSFGQHGQFRGLHMEEERARTPVHSPEDVCAECHEENAELKVNGVHSQVPCGVCHFQPYAGNEEMDTVHPSTSNAPNTSRDACRICHGYLSSRPKSFPQVKDFEKHINENKVKVESMGLGETKPGALCITCHNPHSPKIVVNGG